MKKRIRKILICFLLIVSIFTCLCFTNSKAKADTDIPNANSYMLNLQEIYLSFRGTGANINDFVGTSCIATSNQLVFFKVGNIWFNRIYIQISINYELTIYYLNSYTSQRADVISNNNVIDFNALNINVPDLSLLNNLFYYIESSQGSDTFSAINFFKLLFTNVSNSFPIRTGIYHFNFPNLFGILTTIGYDYRVTSFGGIHDVYWSYRYILYSPNDILLTFDDNSTINCNIILIGSDDNDYLTFYFLKSDFTNYSSLYYFNEENTQFVDNDYKVYDEIDYIYLPYDTSIYNLSSDRDFEIDLSSDYVFNNSFIYGYTSEVHGWNDFFLNIIDVPVMYLRSLTNFEIFGVNLFYTLTGLMTTLFIIWIIRKF